MNFKIPGYMGVGVVLACLAVWVTLPGNIPSWAEQRNLLQFYTSAFTFARWLSGPVSALTAKDDLTSLRSIISSLHVSQDFDSPFMKVTREVYDGKDVRVFRPQPAQQASPAILFIHGGGWSFLEPDLYELLCHHMAENYKTVVIALTYRMAPVHPYPAAFEDCLNTVVYILRNAQTLGLDPHRIAIAGDSAGGNLAAAVSLRLSQPDMASSLPPLKLQVLVYPGLQMTDFNTHSYTNFSSVAMITKEFVVKLWLSYMGYPELRQHASEFELNHHSSQLLLSSPYADYFSDDNLPEGMKVTEFHPPKTHAGNRTLSEKVRSRIVDPYFAPLMAKDVSGLPPAYIILANIDVLRDEGLLYAQRLRKAGVRTEVDIYDTMAHGFWQIFPARKLTFDQCYQSLDKLGQYVKAHL